MIYFNNSFRKRFCMALIICCAFLGIGMSKLRAQTLAAGDIAFIGYDFGTTDGFSFIALKALPAGETIYFSEQGWTATGWATNSETHLQWVIPTTVPIGTIITVMETSADTFTVSGTSGFSIALNSNFNLLGGDQILAYQSTSGVRPASPIFIAGVHGDYNSTNYDLVTTWNESNTAGTAESIVPSGLTNGVNCISLFPAPGPEQAYSKYSGTLTGTATALRAAINNTANWTKTGTASLGLLPANFPTPSITAEVVNPTVTSTAASGIGAVKATLGGNVTADGGATVTERGIVWGLTANPTIADTKVVVGSGTGPFSSVVSSLPANTTVNFRAFATNSSGTAYGNNLTFTTNNALTATTSSTNVSCNGGNNGTATVVPSGGVTPYTYSWSPAGGTNATATGLAALAYTCTITDNEGTSITRSITITQPTTLTATSSKTNVSCNGGSNGTATVVATGGTGPYTYSWAPSGGTAATASGLAVGNYTCTITDNNGCTISRGFTITQPTAMAVTTSRTDLSCNGGSNGIASVNVTGGVAPYTYSWSPSGGTAATATGLVAGSYTCTITDANGCTATRNFTLSQPTALVLNAISQTNIACNGGSTGAATVAASGGVPGYTYSWSPSGGTAATATGLTAGTYTCTVTDANACTKTQSFTIVEPPALTASTSFTTVSCNGGANGTATVTPSGGTGPYTYSWSPSGGTNATATGLPVGVYTVTVTDANACSITRSVTITQPSALTSTASMTTVSCNGGSNGVATVNVSGGTGPYTYSWAPSGGTAATASGLAAGTYTVTVTDANACTLTRTFTLTQPTALTSTASMTTVSCNGGSNGVATVNVSGGTGPYTYSWAPSGGTAATASGLAAGTYTVTVTDANACTLTRSFTITQPTALTATSSFTTVSCNGGANGTASVTASGGTGPYTYSWAPSGGTNATATGLPVGVYTCTITDANACQITRSVTITQPSALTSTASMTTVSCNGGSNGVATVNVSGGTGPYTYSWAPSGGTAATASGLAAGTYTVTVTDANACTLTRTFTLTQPTALTSTASMTTVSCNGGSNGVATVNVSGGTGPYTYSWAPSGGTAATASGLAAGTYTVTVTDANACTLTRTFTITQPAPFTAATSSTNISCNGGSNGTATVIPSGGTGPYTYSWAPSGGTAATATGLAAGTYTVTITDVNTCQITRSVTITQPTALTSTASMTTVACNGGSTGVATVNVSGGTAPYTYSWAPSGGTAATASGLAVGTYTVTVTDANACTLTRSFTITQPTALQLTYSGAAVVSINTPFTYTFVATGGTMGYSYSSSGTLPTGVTLTNGVLSGTPTVAGDYSFTVAVTDANACTKTVNVSIKVESSLPVDLINFAAKAVATGVEVTWTTTSEANSSHFELLHATEKGDFKPLTKVTALGDSKTGKRYSFLHKNAVNGQNYYQLLQVDRNGDTKDYGVKQVNFSQTKDEVLLFPNPASHAITVKFPVNVYSQLQVVDMLGKVVMSSKITAKDQEHKLNIALLPAGVYTVVLSSGHSKTVHKFIKQ